MLAHADWLVDLGVGVLGVSYFKGRTAIVAGASHPLGQSLALRLAKFAATVVAIDTNEDALRALASKAPDRIEPLALNLAQPSAQNILRAAWEHEPLHLCLDLSALMITATQRCPVAGARIAGLASALSDGLLAGAARGVVVLPEPGPDAAPQDHVDAAALVTLVARLPGYAPPTRVCGLTVRSDIGNWSPARCVGVGDLVLILAHPVSRGLKPYQVIASGI